MSRTDLTAAILGGYIGALEQAPHAPLSVLVTPDGDWREVGLKGKKADKQVPFPRPRAE
jgi:hypothetical protein